MTGGGHWPQGWRRWPSQARREASNSAIIRRCCAAYVSIPGPGTAPEGARAGARAGAAGTVEPVGTASADPAGAGVTAAADVPAGTAAG